MCQNQPVVRKVRMGMTFGGFDLLHLGHINLLKQAKDRCIHLIVGLSTDDYLREIKGVEPVLSFEDRKYLVYRTKLVDLVVRQENLKSKEELVREYNPDILLVGNDWTNASYTGEGLKPVIYLERTEGISTTWYKERIKLKSI